MDTVNLENLGRDCLNVMERQTDIAAAIQQKIVKAIDQRGDDVLASLFAKLVTSWSTLIGLCAGQLNECMTSLVNPNEDIEKKTLEFSRSLKIENAIFTGTQTLLLDLCESANDTELIDLLKSHIVPITRTLAEFSKCFGAIEGTAMVARWFLNSNSPESSEDQARILKSQGMEASK